MEARGSLATAWLIAAALSGCAAGAEDIPDEAPDVEEPLELTVDALDIAHGALRISATMVNGAADVSVRLGGDCEHREVGGGLSTPSTLVWSLGDDDVVGAFTCGLVVRARARDGAHHVSKVADLSVAIGMTPDDGNADDGPQLQSVEATDNGVSVVFTALRRSARLTTADSILEAAPPDPDEGDPSASDVPGRFLIPRVDFARSILRGRSLSLDGASFATSIAVNGLSLQLDSPPTGEDVEILQGESEDESSEEAVPEG